MTASKFKLGDWVYCPWHGYGTITTIYDDGCLYPIEVTWDDIRGEAVSPFTKDGFACASDKKDCFKLTVVMRRHEHRKLLNLFREFRRGS